MTKRQGVRNQRKIRVKGRYMSCVLKVNKCRCLLFVLEVQDGDRAAHLGKNIIPIKLGPIDYWSFHCNGSVKCL